MYPLILFLALSLFGFAQSITVTLSGITPPLGEVYLALYNSPKGFLKSQYAYQKVTRHATQNFRYTFRNLPKGEYAIALYHDQNSNGKLDTNLFGIPNEPTGTSLNAPSRMGPPLYEEACFEVIHNLSLTIKLH